MKQRLRRKRGGIMLVIVFGLVMAVVMLGFTRLSQALTTTSKDSAKVYADIQTYRAASEMICYQYLTDVEAAVVTKDLDADWLSITNQAIYSQALGAILEFYDDPDYAGTGWSWLKHDPLDVLETVHITDQSMVDEVMTALSGGYRKFTLRITEPLVIDPVSDDSFETVRKAYLELKPFPVEVDLRVKGEILRDVYMVSKMYLLVTQENVYEVDGTIHVIATLSLVEGEEGCVITRATI